MTLRDQAILVTGCSTGIGRALAVELGRRGHHVFATARRPETLGDITTDRVEALALDVTDSASIDAAVDRVMERAGRIDMLVNNAGFNLIGPVAELPLSGLRKLFETNVTGTVATIQAVFPHMKERGSGRIVNIGSVVGIFPTPFAGGYCATKSAVHTLSDVLRVEVAPFGIDVVVVQPGGVASNIAATASQGLDRYGSDDSAYQRVHENIVARAHESQNRPMPTDAFAKHVAEAITAERAPRVVRAGRGARALPRLARLPSSLLDRALTRRFGLDKL
jgi:NAD(P)-dependent dehydrogenase (short-subunit alcohol dehydrogenase family)